MKAFAGALVLVIWFATTSLIRGEANENFLIPDLRAWEKVKAGLTVAELEELLGQPIRRSNPDGVFKPNVMYRWVYGYVAKKSDVFPEDVAFSVRLMKGEVSSKEDPFGGVAISQDGLPTVPKLMSPPDSTVFSHYPRLLDFRWYASSGEYPMKYEIEVSVQYRASGEWKPNKPREVAIPYCSYLHSGRNPGRWRVRGINTKGKSEWSDYFYFEFDR